jgi:hypothetical protein
VNKSKSVSNNSFQDTPYEEIVLKKKNTKKNGFYDLTKAEKNNLSYIKGTPLRFKSL